MADRFIFRLNYFQITDTMSPHQDTVFVYFALKVRDQIFGPQHQKIGNLNNGIYFLNWEFGPVEVDADTPFVMTYQIVNNGHDDTAKQAQEDIAIANGIAAGVGAIVGAAYPPAAVIVGVITKVLSALGEALKWLFGNINCDGLILSDAVSGNGTTLSGWTHPTGSHQDLPRKYTGPEKPFPCGTAHYLVSWSVVWPDKPKESKETKDKDKEQKDKEHRVKEVAKEKEREVLEAMPQKEREVLVDYFPPTPFDSRFF